MTSTSFDALVDTVKLVAATLRDAEIPFTLAGGLASWARGGPRTEHDIDIAVRPEDADRVCELLSGKGMTIERPPEAWLFKAWQDDVLVDIIFQPSGSDAGDIIERSEVLEVGGVAMPVMVADDIMVTKLLALREHYLPYDSVLQTARALREQVAWDQVRSATSGSPFARAFFTMAEGLGVVPA